MHKMLHIVCDITMRKPCVAVHSHQVLMLTLMLIVVQDIDGLVLVAPAITVFSADLRAKAKAASG